MRYVRVSDELWSAAQTRAKERGDNLSEIIRQRLTDYTHEQPAQSGGMEGEEQ